MWVPKNEGEVLLGFTLSRYQRRARTGHQTLSSDTEENEEREGKKISNKGDLTVWFLAIKPARGMRRTPEASQRMWPGSTESACKVLTLWPEAIATKNTVLRVRWCKEALCKGSKGSLERAWRTAGRLHAGRSDLQRGRLRFKNAWNIRDRIGEEETEEPSSKPEWQEAKFSRPVKTDSWRRQTFVKQVEKEIRNQTYRGRRGITIESRAPVIETFQFGIVSSASGVTEGLSGELCCSGRKVCLFRLSIFWWAREGLSDKIWLTRKRPQSPRKKRQ